MQNVATWENYTIIGYILGCIYLRFVLKLLMKFFDDSKENIYNFIIAYFQFQQKH